MQSCKVCCLDTPYGYSATELLTVAESRWMILDRIIFYDLVGFVYLYVLRNLIDLAFRYFHVQVVVSVSCARIVP